MGAKNMFLRNLLIPVLRVESRFPAARCHVAPRGDIFLPEMARVDLVQAVRTDAADDPVETSPEQGRPTSESDGSSDMHMAIDII